MNKILLLLLLFSLQVFAVTPDSVLYRLDLSGWVALAYENSPVLISSSADLESAEAALVSARSFLFPRVSMTTSGGHTWSSTPDGAGGYTASDQSSWQASLSFSQELLASGGSSWLELEGSRHSLLASQYEAESARLNLVLDVTEKYYGVVEAIGQMETVERGCAKSLQLYERTLSLYELGATTNLELIQAEVQMSRDLFTLSQKETAVTASYIQLFEAAGVINSEYTVNTAAVLSPVTREVAENFDLDISANPSYLASKERLQTSELSFDAASRNYWPSLSLGGSWSWNNDKLEFDNFGNEDNWNISASLSWTLFDGFSRESMIQSRRAAVISIDAGLESLENNLISSSILALNSLLGGIDSYELALLVLEQTREQLLLSEQLYALGSITLAELLDAEAEYTQAEASLVSARVDCLINEARILVLLGENPRLGE